MGTQAEPLAKAFFAPIVHRAACPAVLVVYPGQFLRAAFCAAPI
jgi:hypothetical protein